MSYFGIFLKSLHRKKIQFSPSANLKNCKMVILHRNLAVGNDFFIIITSCFFSPFSLHSREVILYDYCPVGIS